MSAKSPGVVVATLAGVVEAGFMLNPVLEAILNSPPTVDVLFRTITRAKSPALGMKLVILEEAGSVSVWNMRPGVITQSLHDCTSVAVNVRLFVSADVDVAIVQPPSVRASTVVVARFATEVELITFVPLTQYPLSLSTAVKLVQSPPLQAVTPGLPNP